MAIKFHLRGGIDTDIVAQSYDGFPVRTAEEILYPPAPWPRAALGSRARHRSPTSWQAILRRKRFVEAPKPAPASFATETILRRQRLPLYQPGRCKPQTSVTGSARKWVRITWIPPTRPAGCSFSSTSLPRDSLAALPGSASSFSSQTTATRSRMARCRGPKSGRRSSWAASPSPLGWRTVGRPERRLLFDPARLVDGIELSEDALPLARSAVYAIAYQRRNAQPTTSP